MPVRKKTSTTRLPQALHQQIAESSGASDHPQRQNYARRHGSRKEARKQEREAQKHRKAQHFSHITSARKRAADEDHHDSPQRKKARPNEDAVPEPSSKPPSQPSTSQTKTPKENLAPVPSSSTSKSAPSVSKPVKKAPKTSALEKLATKSRRTTAPTLRTPQDDKEDAYIAYLEAQLGMKKGEKKKKAKADEDDGLDDLMNWADSFNAPKPSAHYSDESEEDIGSNPSGDEDENNDGHSSEDSSEYDGEEEEEEWQGIGGGAAASSEDTEAETPAQPVAQPTTGAYVPPHLRNLQTDPNSEALLKLKRQLKGLLNRMTEQNIASIVDAVEEVYREHRRNDVSSTLTSLIIEGISSHSSLLDSYVVLHAAFVSALHKVIGIEFAAHFIQTVVTSYEKHYAELQAAVMEVEPDGKECSNLLVLLSELYNFQVISNILVFDLIRALLDGDLTEFKVELLLKLARNSGQQLRVDDPSALKDIIEIVQTKTTKTNALSSRTRFMIETLTNLKNNKLKRNATQNQGGASVERMKKFLSGLTKTKHVLAHDALRVSLDDLHSADTKGKWWLVGAAWGGNPLVDKKDEFAKSSTTAAPAKIEKDLVADESADLVQLARLQGMNTDIRRGIFVVLMSSEDYVDACERLSQLDLNEVQQREIIRVILHCCGNERSYNPYYTLVCQQLCRLSHSYKITLQFSLWDFLRDMGEKTVGGAAVVKNADDADDFDVKSISETRMKNVANAYAWWIAKDCLTLLVLKPVDFTILKLQTKVFLNELFSQIFINSQRSTLRVGTASDANTTYTRNRNAIEEIFAKAARMQTLAMGIVYFLSEEFKAKRELPGTDDYAKFIRWAVGVAKDTLRTSVDIASVL